MTKAEMKRATDIMRHLIRIGRSPLLTRKGNAMIASFVAEFTEKPKPKKKPTVAVD